MTDPAQNDGESVPATKGVLLQTKGLTVHTSAGESLLSDVSIHIEPGELVALTGLSRSGKSTLLQSLAGQLKPTSGEILIDGISLYANLKAFRSSIGFVPADYALQQNLTVTEVLQEAARLRLPRRASSQDRLQRVRSLLEIAGLTQVADHRVGLLNPVEKRKLSIVVELISYPGILLVDKSAQLLTPFEELQITILLRELSRQGLTIIQVDERSRSAGMSEKVIFLVPGGSVAWFGPPDEAFIYLRSLLPRGVVKDLFGLKEALEILGNPQVQEGIEWAKRFKAHPAYQKYVEDPLDNRYPDLMLQTKPLLRLRLRNSSSEKVPPPIIPRASNVQKLILLFSRNFRLLWRDRTVFSMLAIPPLLALVDLMLTSSTAIEPADQPMIFGFRVFLILLSSGLLFQNEIFKERAVYQRESRTTALAFPYILSKVGLVVIWSIYQGLVWTILHSVATGLTGGLQVLSNYAITVFLVALIGGILGLLASTVSRSGLTTTRWVLLFTIPQLVLSGSVIPLAKLNAPFRFLSQVNPSRYAFETLLAVSGYGQELINVVPSIHWFALITLSLCLMILLLAIQQGTERAGT